MRGCWGAGMNEPKDVPSFPSVIDLMRIRPQMAAVAAIGDRGPTLLARLRHRFRMAAVFCELLFSDVHTPGKR